MKFRYRKTKPSGDSEEIDFKHRIANSKAPQAELVSALAKSLNVQLPPELLGKGE